ncbi:two-component system, OmpR family, response regulator CssR [Pelagirhabdus alkalitolerans]|uniref:Two-component system, OmpR family, response regulator CssR n=1 Tax=Pelagirhabdus alkalitolerans TaxID=1612202 RepID=A0A1G6JH99_9BACI|nr:response regulator transcription factor [Pelagirhabdus alkalitolerans]SDC18073.1 two-component system, OmpR family, response regulator CssR [Pelagirhabdus alkalitolerans]
MAYHIFIVEDDPNIRDIVSAYLKKEGYIVSLVDNAEEAWQQTRLNQPDMWILDIMLPGMDGYELCKKIRDESDVPIIIISAKDEEVDKILGLELGSDDYLTKPFSPRELLARVKRLFKRVEAIEVKSTPRDNIYQVDTLILKPDDRRVFFDDDEIEVTSKEYDLLFHLIQSQNRAFSREELLTLIWGDDYFGSDRAVDDLVKRLRKKMEGVPIETVWGYGYRLRTEAEGGT